jgi:hypothetical protein
MRDTPPDIEDRYRRQLMGLTPTERLAMGCRMFGTAKALIRAGIAQGGPVSRTEARRLMFVRLYGQDFSETERAKILAHLEAT